jgi:beta-lactamase
MQLVEQGKLNLDVDISTYVDVNIQRRFPGDITLRNLLTHTAGFEEHAGIAAQGSELESYILQDPPTQIYAPGTTPAYSNYGMSLAGYIVQKVSGERFEDYIRDHIFTPAGMDSSTYEQPLPTHLTDRMANGYQSIGSTAHPFQILADSPAGSMTTSGTDAGRFMLALLGQSQGSPLLQESTWQQMFSPALTTDQLGTLAKGKQMGLGFFDENRNGHQIVGHGGDLSSHFHADLEVYPGDGNGIFIAVNGSGKDMAVALRSDLMRDFSDRYHPGTAPTPGEKPTVDESRQHAQQVAGTYFSARTFLTTFFSVMNALPAGWGTLTSLGNGNLLLGRGGSVTEYEEIAPWVWRAVDGSNTITAQVENGTVVRIGATPAFSMLPVTPAQKAFLPVMVIATAVLVLFLVAWPAGAIRRWQAKRKGETAPSVPPDLASATRSDRGRTDTRGNRCLGRRRYVADEQRDIGGSTGAARDPGRDAAGRPRHRPRRHRPGAGHPHPCWHPPHHRRVAPAGRARGGDLDGPQLPHPQPRRHLLTTCRAPRRRSALQHEPPAAGYFIDARRRTETSWPTRLCAA